MILNSTSASRASRLVAYFLEWYCFLVPSKYLYLVRKNHFLPSLVGFSSLYTVIDKMTHSWLSNGKLEEYLRPITLFGDKFEEYLEGNWERNEVDWSSQYYDTVY